MKEEDQKKEGWRRGKSYDDQYSYPFNTITDLKWKMYLRSPILLFILIPSSSCRTFFCLKSKSDWTKFKTEMKDRLTGMCSEKKRKSRNKIGKFR